MDKFIDGSEIPSSYLDKVYELIGAAAEEDPGEEGECIVSEVRKLEQKGWKLCVGCRESLSCRTCSIDFRKLMGFPPGNEDAST